MSSGSGNGGGGLWGQISKTADWLRKQSTETVLLVAILAVLLAGIAGMGRWVASAIPKHLEQIQSGYERIEASHDKQVERLMQQHENERRDSLEILRALLNGREVGGGDADAADALRFIG